MRSGESSAAYEIAHVLFVDIVGYSLQTIDRQSELVTLLQTIVRESAEFQRAKERKELISLPTGDGLALAFMRDPLSPVRCAVQVAATLRRNKKLSVRMGIHTGPVQRQADIREEVNVVGGGINTAQRVMDCGDAGHILLSRNVAEVLEQLSDWRDCLRDLGEQQVKHGVKVHLYNLVKPPAGNPAVPAKLAASAGQPIAVAPEVKSDVQPASAGPNRLMRRVVLFMIVFLWAWVLTEGSEMWLERGIASGEVAGVVQAAFTFNGIYQRIVA